MSLSKLPIRQVTNDVPLMTSSRFSKLPIRQVTSCIDDFK